MNFADAAFQGRSIERIPDPLGGGSRVYRFEVIRAYKGLGPSVHEVLVQADSSPGMCETRYTPGEVYLILAYGDGSPVYRSNACAGSRLVRGHQTDVEFLERYSRGESKTVVLGKVMQFENYFGTLDEVQTPLADATVLLENATYRFESKSESDGSFRFEDVPPGEYLVSGRLAPFVPSPSPRWLEIQQGCCQEVFLPLRAGSAISGNVTTFDGQPAPGLRVGLRRWSSAPGSGRALEFSAETDGAGEFRFRDIPSGLYWVGTGILESSNSNLEATPPTYFPGVGSLRDAELVSVEPGESRNSVGIRLARPDTPRDVRITLVQADAWLSTCSSIEIQNHGERFAWIPTSGLQSPIRLPAFRERHYEIRAVCWRAPSDPESDSLVDQPFAESDVVKVVPGCGSVLIRATLNPVSPKVSR